MAAASDLGLYYLGLAEELVALLHEVPDLHRQLKVATLIQDAKMATEQVAGRVAGVGVVCQGVLDSSRVKTLLRVALQAANFLNQVQVQLFIVKVIVILANNHTAWTFCSLCPLVRRYCIVVVVFVA